MNFGPDSKSDFELDPKQGGKIVSLKEGLRKISACLRTALKRISAPSKKDESPLPESVHGVKSSYSKSSLPHSTKNSVGGLNRGVISRAKWRNRTRDMPILALNSPSHFLTKSRSRSWRLSPRIGTCWNKPVRSSREVALTRSGDSNSDLGNKSIF